jgi:hypothetical protein
MINTTLVGLMLNASFVNVSMLLKSIYEVNDNTVTLVEASCRYWSRIALISN